MNTLPSEKPLTELDHLVTAGCVMLREKNGPNAYVTARHFMELWDAAGYFTRVRATVAIWAATW